MAIDSHYWCAAISSCAAHIPKPFPPGGSAALPSAQAGSGGNPQEWQTAQGWNQAQLTLTFKARVIFWVCQLQNSYKNFTSQWRAVVCFLLLLGCCCLCRDLSWTTRGPAQGLLGTNELITISLSLCSFSVFQPVLIISGSLNWQWREMGSP